MKKAIVIGLMAITTLVLLVLAGAGIFLATFNPNEYKNTIRDAVYEATAVMFPYLVL